MTKLGTGEIRASIRSERAALAADLADLEPAGWETPSLCEGWTVRMAVAHLVATARATVPRTLAALLRARFALARFQRAEIERHQGTSPADLHAALVSIARSGMVPRGPDTLWLSETLIHAADVRRPLGIPHTYPTEPVLAVLALQLRLPGPAKSRARGVRLTATDAAWSSGEGAEAYGPALAILMAVTGRTAYCADLTGPGVVLLQGR